MTDPHTRSAFDAQRAAGKRLERREGRFLAAESVGLGVAIVEESP